MKSIIHYFLKYPVLGNGIMVMLFLFGFVSYSTIKTTFFPTTASKIIMITASYPGASPEEIEEGITLKIEDNLKGLTGIERITSTSLENAVSIIVELKTGYDAMDILQEVKNKIDAIYTFPVGMEQINVFRQERIDFVIAFALSGDKDLRTLKSYARRIERDLLNKDGISKVTLGGFPNEEIEISLREEDLNAFQLTYSEVAAAISSANIKITGGKIKGPKEEFQIRADNKGYYAEDLKNLVIRSTEDGAIVRLKDVGNVIDRWAEDPTRNYFNGKPSVIIDVSKTNDEDLFQIAGTVKDYIAEYQKNHPELKIDILRDGSAIIQERVDILTGNGMIGIVLVLLLLGLTLNARMAFWVALSIPISFAGMFMIAGMYGMTINVMSLMAMILVIGILVDDGIVIAENIYQHYENGEKPMEAAINGTMEVLPSVVSAVLTTVIIFATFFFLEGGIGDHASDIAFVVIATLMISLVEATFILPAHIAHSKALRQKTSEHSWIERHSEKVLFWFRDRVYRPILDFCLSHPSIAIAVPTALFIITIGALGGGIIKTTFFPVLEFDNVNVTLEMPAGTASSVTDSIMKRIEASAWAVNDDFHEQFPDEPLPITNIARNMGGGTHQGSLRVILLESKLRNMSSMELTTMLRKHIGAVKGAEKLQIGGGSRWGMPVSIALKSDNIDRLRLAKETLRTELNKVDRLKDVITNDAPGLREVKLTLKEKAHALGLTTTDVMNQVRSGFWGREAQRLLRGIDEVRIWVRLKESERMALDQLKNMRIRVGNQSIPLKELADMSIERGVMSLAHIDGQRVITVEADIADSKESVTAILADVQSDIMPDIIKKFPEVTFDFEGQSRENKKTVRAFATVLPVILILTFMVVVFTFRSFSQAIIVFSLVPLAFIGVAWGHFIQGYIMSMLSMFGIIALIGVLVNDSLVFVNAMNRLLVQGKPFREALLEAGISRFRPVLLTSLTTIAGLAPLMFETSHQAQFLSPMAISLAYGLLIGTFMTLLLLPTLLMLYNQLKVFVFGKLRREGVTPESVEPAVIEELFVKKYSVS